MPSPDAAGHTHLLSSLTYPEVEAILRSSGPTVALLPIGSTEAHGPHLPLGTDSIIATAMADAAGALLAERGYEAVRFPPFHYAVTDWAGDFAGSTSLPTDTATGLVRDAALAAKKMGFGRVVLVNAHLEPRHIQTLRAAAQEFEEQAGEPLLFPDKTSRRIAEQLTDEFRSGSCHAGQYETSIVMAARPDLVRSQLASALPEKTVPLHEHIRAGAQNFIDCGMDQAYCGAPAGATAEEGEETLRTLGRVIADAVERSFAPPESG